MLAVNSSLRFFLLLSTTIALICMADLRPAGAWGQKSYAEELDQYQAQVSDYQHQFNQLSAQERGMYNQLQAYIAEWSQEDRLKAYNWFENNYKNARPARNRYQNLKAEYNRALQDYQEQYNELLSIDIQREDIVSRHARDVLWSAELKMLDLRLQAMRALHQLRGLELYAIKAYEGIYWTEFFNDTMHDLQYILKDYVNNLGNEFYNCFLNTATAFGMTKMLKRQPPVIGVGFGTLNKSGQAYQCVKGIALNSIVNALEAACRKQFVDSMEDRGIETQVAEFWWSNYVMPKAASQTRGQQALRHFFSMKFVKTQFKDELKRYLEQSLKSDIKDGLVKRLKNLASTERYGDNAKRLVERVAKQRTNQHVAMQVVAMADFGIKYGERALTLYYNQANFEGIADDLIRKHLTIVECLRRKKRPHHAAAIIGVFKYSQEGWRDFIRDCNKSKAVQCTDDSWRNQWQVTKNVSQYLDQTQGKKEFKSNPGWKESPQRIGDANPPSGGGTKGIRYMHPLSRNNPAVQEGAFDLTGITRLRIVASGNCDTNGDFVMKVNVAGKTIGLETVGCGWRTSEFDLSGFTGRQRVTIEVHANGWHYEYAFFDCIILE